MDGCLCVGDGCMADVFICYYGMGGMLGGKIYMLLMMFNVLKEVFDDFGEFFFQGKLVDDFMYLIYQNFCFFDMCLLVSFVVYDVMKNLDIEYDF